MGVWLIPGARTGAGQPVGSRPSGAAGRRARRPVVALVGAEHEENLSLRYLAAAVEKAGFRAELISTAERDPDAIATRILAVSPLVVGLSLPFQGEARATLAVASALRRRGFPGHICAGGHFATFEYKAILDEFEAIDSVVRHEGEETLPELCRRVRDGIRAGGVDGLVVRGSEGPVVGAPRSLPPLHRLPTPDRRGEPHRVLGVPVAPILGSRGCYADCSFCCISAYHRTARGPRYRRRPPEEIVAEMELERQRRGVRLFVFHDDNFFLPHRQRNLDRYSHFARLLREEGLSDVALVVKCRPNDVDPDLFRLLKETGLIRVYVGIETNSGEGIVSLNRRVTAEDNRRALGILGDLDLYCSFNVLIFDPEATLEGVEANLDFMEQMADRPFNFCRAEVYAGTPLRRMLEAQGRLRGDYFAWNYEMRDPRVEVLFRIVSTAFDGRNFKADGVHNLNMGIRFDNEVLRFFHPGGWDMAWHANLVSLSRHVGLHSVREMRSALAFARSADPWDHEAVKAFALELAREVAGADLAFIGRFRTLRREMDARATACGGPPSLKGVTCGADDGPRDWRREPAWRWPPQVSAPATTTVRSTPLHRRSRATTTSPRG